jgi:hypothetical protein
VVGVDRVAAAAEVEQLHKLAGVNHVVGGVVDAPAAVNKGALTSAHTAVWSEESRLWWSCAHTGWGL